MTEVFQFHCQEFYSFRASQTPTTMTSLKGFNFNTLANLSSGLD